MTSLHSCMVLIGVSIERFGIGIGIGGGSGRGRRVNLLCWDKRVSE